MVLKEFSEDKVEAFNKELENAGDILVLVDFHATWCGPCKRIAPTLMELHGEHGSKIIILKIDIDICSDVAENCKVSCMPTFHFYKNMKQVDQLLGASEEKLKAKVVQHIN